MTRAIVICHAATRRHPITDAAIRSVLPEGWNFERFSVEPESRELDAFDETYDWRAAAELQCGRHDELLALQTEHPDAELFYLGLAPIPLVFHFGTLLGQTTKIRIFQHHHENLNWAWPSTDPSNPEVEVHQPRRDSEAEGDLLIRVALSYPLSDASTQHIDAALVQDLIAKLPNPDLLKSKADLALIGRKFKDLLDYGAHFPHARVRHVMASVTVGAALAMGMQVNRTIHLPIQTWNYIHSRELSRIPAIRIGDYVDAPGILLLAAAPSDETPITAVSEVQQLRGLFSACSNRLRIHDRPALTASMLIDALHEFRPTMIHVAAHGARCQSGGAALVVLDRLETSFPVEAEDMVHLLADLPQVRCLVFGTCFGADLAAKLGSESRSVIGFVEKVDDAPAREFAIRFWSSIAAGKSIRTAYRDGRMVLREEARDQLRIFPPLDSPVHECVPVPDHRKG